MALAGGGRPSRPVRHWHRIPGVAGTYGSPERTAVHVSTQESGEGPMGPEEQRVHLGDGGAFVQSSGVTQHVPSASVHGEPAGSTWEQDAPNVRQSTAVAQGTPPAPHSPAVPPGTPA